MSDAYASRLEIGLPTRVLVGDVSLSGTLTRVLPTIENGVLRTLEVDPSLGIGMPMEVATEVDAPAASAAILERLLRV